MSGPTSELAVHLGAAEHGANAAALVDSAQFMAGVEALGPNSPGFIARVSEAVGKAVAADRERFGSAPAPTPAAPEAPRVPLSRQDVMLYAAQRRAALGVDYQGEITVEDVQLAEPAVVNSWARSGRLAHLGVATKQRRTR